MRRKQRSQALETPVSETALTRYARLESLGIWIPEPGARRVNVLVSFGTATLVITDPQERPLSHWSLAAVTRVNPGNRPALFAPSAEAMELLEIDDDAMIEALETVRRATRRQQSRGGRVRRLLAAAAFAAVAAGAVLLGPDMLRNQAEQTLPPAARAEIGGKLLDALIRVGGVPCDGPGGSAALARLANRLPGTDRLVLLAGGPDHALPLPGGTIVLGRRMVEDFDLVDVVAGHILAGQSRAAAQDPLRAVLQTAGVSGTLTLLTTGHLPEEIYARHAEHLMRSAAPPAPAQFTDLLDRFAAAQLPASPYAYALDITGETTLPLIEADAIGLTEAAPLLADRDWLSLQTICE